ncbi:uncharacterized protein LY89DRAFT_790012 [Mollisia scopiformis]|uniref:Uncharacterized protein n=1 Tax=Mollisia scopiformis TaxID=149040 RepID=A0A132B5H3_MOLSC|nr:uncharacterized protein LY89DRAFT_790012 [Mollisia scopiformis]KUJ07239.1 hypothetical protein LY89DRAFT_790012 [Mollisia scopiformis]
MASVGEGTTREKEDAFLLTASFWKRFVVVLSISLSVAGLILSAIASLMHEDISHQRRLTISGIIINASSISLSALTSLDWKRQKTHDRVFADQLCRIAHAQVDGDGQIVIGAKDSKNLS